MERIKTEGYKTISGNELRFKSEYNSYNGNITIHNNTNDDVLKFNEQLLSQHIMFLGSIGTGKTNAIFQIIDQIKYNMTDDDIMIIFDSKGDFLEEFYFTGDVVISNDERATGKTKINYWNIFEELSKKNIEEEINEISRTLFFDKIKSSNQSFFPLSAKDIFSSIMLATYRTQTNPNNKTVKDILDRLDQESIKEILEEHEDLKAMTSYISGSGGQTQGTISELQQLSREIFIGNFKKEGSLSIRNLVKEKNATTIFIEYDLVMGNILTPIYRLLLDLAIKESLSQKESHKKGNVYFVIDEFKLIPFLQHISDGVNFGRSLGAKFIIGIQSIEQLYDIYGQHQARAILSGFSTTINFRLNDQASREYVKGLFGNNVKSFYYSPPKGDLATHTAVANVIEDWDITNLKLGQSIIGLPEKEPFIFQFKSFEDYKNSI